MLWLLAIVLMFPGNAALAAPDFATARKLIQAFQEARKKEPDLAVRLKAMALDHAEDCKVCHGPAGISTQPGIPHLAGQNPIYLAAKLLEFRKAGEALLFMHIVAHKLDDEAILALALYYTDLPPPKPILPPSPAGKAIYEERCQHCHGPGAKGEASYPRLAGQEPGYLKKTLEKFSKKDPTRKSDIMHAIVKDLEAKDLEALVAYLNHPMPEEDDHVR